MRFLSLLFTNNHNKCIIELYILKIYVQTTNTFNMNKYNTENI